MTISRLDFTEEAFIDSQVVAGKAAEDDLFKYAKLQERRADSVHGNLGGQIKRIAVDASADAWEGQYLSTLLGSKLYRKAVTGS